MKEYKKLIIKALEAGNIEEVKRLKPEFDEETAREKWLESHSKDGGVPISAWLEPNPFISWK